MSKKSELLQNDSNFEKALFIALSRNGFLIPTNENQASEFEKKTGTTKIEVPSELQESDLMFTSKGNGSAKSETKIRKFDETEELYLKVASSKKGKRKRNTKK